MKVSGNKSARWKRLAIGCAATILAVAAYLMIGFPENLDSIQTWWLTTVALGGLILLLTRGSDWQRAGVVASALLIGGSAQLGMTEPSWFPYIQLRPKTDFDYFMLAAILIQAFIATRALSMHMNTADIARLIRSLGVLRISVLAFLVIGVSTTAMRHIGGQNYWALLKQLSYFSTLSALNIATVFVLAASLPNRALERIAHRLTEVASFPGASEKVRAFDTYLPWVAAAFVFVASSVLCLSAFQRMPHVPDEVAYLFQAQYFLEGRLSVPAPSVPPPFSYDFLSVSGSQWFSIFPPGWPAALALGIAVSSPWIVNPLLAAIAILLTHAVLCRVATRGSANIAILLIAISPWFIAMSASLMSHMLTLVLVLAAWLALLKGRAEGATHFAVLSGLFMGFLFLTRPLDGLLLGSLTGLWSLGFLKDRSGWPLVLGYGLGCIAVGALVFPYHASLTGDPMLTPINHYFGELWHEGANRLGFGADIGPPDQWQGIDAYPGHQASEALINAQHNLNSLQSDLFGWSIGSMAFFFAHILWGRWSRFDIYMLIVIVAVIGAYSLYWFSGGFYIGPRYWFMAFLPMIAITASGIRTTVMKLCSWEGSSLTGQRVGFVVAILGVFAIVSFLTWRGVTKYYEFRGFHTDYRAMVENPALDGSLIFVRTSNLSDFGSAYVFNSPSLSGPEPIFARDLGAVSNRAVAASFPNRPIYFAEGRSEGQGKARIVRGPITRDSLP